MNLTTSQWRSVSSGMPFSRAICSASRSFHCSGSVRKPSASTSMLVSAIIVAVMSSSLARVDWNVLLAEGRQRRAEAGDLPPRQQRVPVDPLEHQFAEVVEPRLAQQRQRAEVARQRLGLVVEVDQQCLVEAGLDETVGVAVVARVELLVGEETRDVLGQHLRLEVGDRAGF